MRIDRIKLITAMAKADMKGYELAERARLSRYTVVGIRSGKTCTRETAERIAGALGLSLEELTEG